MGSDFKYTESTSASLPHPNLSEWVRVRELPHGPSYEVYHMKVRELPHPAARPVITAVHRRQQVARNAPIHLRPIKLLLLAEFIGICTPCQH